MSILEKLYRGEIYPKECKLKQDSQYDRAKNRSLQSYETLKTKLNADELKLLERLLDSQNTMTTKENMHFFTQGFKMGMSMVIDTLK